MSMNKSKYLESVNDMIYLIYCVINNHIPDTDKINNINPENLYLISKNHMLTAITAVALESAGLKFENFTQAKGKACRKNATLDIERAALFKYFDSENIWYVPLKGAVLKDYYPEFGMREMSDNDILFDSSYREQAKKYFETNGYETKKYGSSNHDIYLKKPVSNFEMHVELFEESYAEKYPEIREYYKNVQKRLIKNDTGSGCHFSNEDFYIYIITHAYKHYSIGGTGLRSLLDIYVFMKKFGDTLKTEYIETELQKMKIAEYERSSRHLAMNLFGKNKLADEDREMFEYIVFSGAYGTKEHIVKNRMDRFNGSKLRYVFYKIFPPVSKLKKRYPVFFKHKILLPFLPFYRLFRAFTVKRERAKTEIKLLLKYKS